MIIFLFLVIIIFSFFMRSIGGLKVRRAKPRKGENLGRTMIVLEWNKLSEWWQEKRKSVFKRKKELQKHKEKTEENL